MSAKRYLSFKDFDNPAGINFDFKEPIELKNLNVLIGANGTGKSYFMYLYWLMNNSLFLVETLSKHFSVPMNEACEVLKNELEFMMSPPFDDYKKYKGSIILEVENIVRLSLHFPENSIEVSVDILDEEAYKAQQPLPAIYNTISMRTLSAVKRYWKLRKKLNDKEDITEDKDTLKELGEFYKLQDIFFAELFIAKLETINFERTEENEILFDGFDLLLSSSHIGEGLEYMKGDKENVEVWLKFENKDEPIPVSSTAEGVQSIVMMFLAQLL